MPCSFLSLEQPTRKSRIANKRKLTRAQSKSFRVKTINSLITKVEPEDCPVSPCVLYNPEKAITEESVEKESTDK